MVIHKLTNNAGCVLEAHGVMMSKGPGSSGAVLETCGLKTQVPSRYGVAIVVGGGAGGDAALVAAAFVAAAAGQKV